MSTDRANMISRMKELREDKDLMNLYLKMKIRQQDWHGVADAAMDLRDIEAEVKGLELGMEHLDWFAAERAHGK